MVQFPGEKMTQLKTLLFIVLSMFITSCADDTSGDGSCGDGNKNLNEECDGTDLNSKSCISLGYGGGDLGCLDNCTFDFTLCNYQDFCGDNVLQADSEECDGPEFGEETCSSLGFYGGELSCSSDCTIINDSCQQCGDGIIQDNEGEICDGENFNGNSCELLGLPQGNLACNSSCRLIYDGCTEFEMWGTSVTDVGNKIVTHGSASFVIGTTLGNLDNWGNSGGSDLFVSKYDESFTRVWTRIAGGADEEEAMGATIDKDGDLYITGSSSGSLWGSINNGYHDILLAKYDQSGDFIWGKVIGTMVGDYGQAVTSDQYGNIYLTGYSYGDLGGELNQGEVDVFLQKFTSDGTLLWTTMWGTDSNDYGYGVFATDGNIYITGQTGSALDGNISNGGNDIFLTKVDSSGSIMWTKQWGSDLNDGGNDVSMDSSGNIIVTGFANGDLGNGSEGGYDYVISSFSQEGAVLWSIQGGTVSNDYGNGITTCGNAIYITGMTDGDMDGEGSGGSGDLFLVRVDLGGGVVWSRQWGGSSQEKGLSVACDENENPIFTGYSRGEFHEMYHSGNEDVFIGKSASLSDIPAI
jgi:hypothetical protein